MRTKQNDNRDKFKIGLQLVCGKVLFVRILVYYEEKQYGVVTERERGDERCC
jgi:hypothetical protein